MHTWRRALQRIQKQERLIRIVQVQPFYDEDREFWIAYWTGQDYREWLAFFESRGTDTAI